jgi:hypothetical protein
MFVKDWCLLIKLISHNLFDHLTLWFIYRINIEVHNRHSMNSMLYACVSVDVNYVAMYHLHHYIKDGTMKF